jgi:hypothetical protein
MSVELQARLEAAQLRIAQLETLVKKVEWQGLGSECPWCRWGLTEHSSDCPAFDEKGEVK